MFAMSALKALRKIVPSWSRRRDEVETLLRVDQATEDEWASLLPGRSSRADNGLVDEGAHHIQLPSEPMHCSNAASTTMDGAQDAIPDFAPDLLDGLWQVEDLQRDTSMMKVQMRFFIIDGPVIRTADMEGSHIMSIEGRPNTIIFRDAQGELISNDIFELTLANGTCVRYCRMCLPHPSVLAELQGAWVQHSTSVSPTDRKLNFEGALVKVSKKGKVTPAALHVRQNDGSMMLGNKVVEIHFCGSLFLRTASGSLRRYVRRTCPVMGAIPEESFGEVSQ